MTGFGDKIFGTQEKWVSVKDKKYQVKVSLYEENGMYNYYEKWTLGYGSADGSKSQSFTSLTQEEAKKKIEDVKERGFYYTKSYMNLRAPQWIKDIWFPPK